MTRAPDLIIGVGNEWRHDDGVGPAVARACASRVPATSAGRGGIGGEIVEIVILDGEPARLVDAWTGRRRVVLIDAVVSGREPGAVARFEVGTDELPGPVRSPSSHASGILDAVALGGALGQLPPTLIVFGVEGADFGDGAGLSPPVAAAVDETADRVLAELAGPEPPCRVPAESESESQASAEHAHESGPDRGREHDVEVRHVSR